MRAASLGLFAPTTRPSRRRAGVLVALALSLCGARDARARPEPSPGAIMVWGSASAHLRAIIRSAAEGELRAAGWELAPLDVQDEERFGSCFHTEAPWPCLAPLLRQRELSRVLALQIEREPAQVRLAGQLAAADGQHVTLDFRYCAPCKDADAGRAVRSLIHQLLSDGAVRGATTKILVRTRPPGATVRIDGRMIDAPGNEIAASPGEHTLFLQLSGYRSELRTVALAEGQTLVVEVIFASEAPRPSPAPPAGPASWRGARPTAPGTEDRRLRRAGALGLIASGAAALVAGVVLVALDEDVTSDVRVAHRRTYYDSAAGGVAIGVAGALAIAGGFALWPRVVGRQAGACERACAMADPPAWLVSWSTSY